MQPIAINDKSNDLYQAVMALGEGWHSRAEIAVQVGKRRLNPTEILLLDLLVDQGKLEREVQPGSRANLSQWAYRVK